MRVARRIGLSFRLVRSLLAAAVIAALPGLLASCTSSGTGAAATASNAGHGGAFALNNIGTLKSLFNRNDGHARLILIFSPT